VSKCFVRFFFSFAGVLVRSGVVVVVVVDVDVDVDVVQEAVAHVEHVHEDREVQKENEEKQEDEDEVVAVAALDEDESGRKLSVSDPVGDTGGDVRVVVEDEPQPPSALIMPLPL
jgi:hypothetical protein